LMVDAGLIVLVSFISPFRAERRMARELLQPEEFFEVFVDTPLAVAESRDPKGLYKKARQGALKHFTGIDSPYEEPEQPEIRIKSDQLNPEQAAELPEFFLRRFAGQRTVLEHGIQHVDLPRGNEMIPLAGAALAAIQVHVRLAPDRDCTRVTVAACGRAPPFPQASRLCLVILGRDEPGRR